MEKSSSGKIKETQRGILYFDRGYAVFNLQMSSPIFKYVTVLFDLNVPKPIYISPNVSYIRIQIMSKTFITEIKNLHPQYLN